MTKPLTSEFIHVWRQSKILASTYTVKGLIGSGATAWVVEGCRKITPSKRIAIKVTRKPVRAPPELNVKELEVARGIGPSPYITAPTFFLQ